MWVRRPSPRNSSDAARLAGTALTLGALAAGCGFSSDRPGDPVLDGGPPTTDAPPGNTGFCFGPSGWQVCFDADPVDGLSLNGPIDTDRTDAASPCVKGQPASWTAALQPEACFIVADKVTIATVRATGRRPLVIVGATGIAVNELLDVSSHAVVGAAVTTGAGAQPGDCQPFKSNPANGQGAGGGAGGSFTTQAGNGGTGDHGNRQNGQAATADLGAPGRLRGGCAGQDGAGGRGGHGGAGGGAVYLVSGGAIEINGTINASGAGGEGGDGADGGGGGGSGGLIALYGATIKTQATSLLLANGGGGGGGSSAMVATIVVKGGPGEDPEISVPVTAASGGAGGHVVSPTGGDGGNGGDGFPATGGALDGRGGDANAGGAGGGGGAGHIRTSGALGAATASPAAVTAP